MEPVQKLYDRLKEVLAQASVAVRQGKTSRYKDLMRQVPLHITITLCRPLHLTSPPLHQCAGSMRLGAFLGDSLCSPSTAVSLRSTGQAVGGNGSEGEDTGVARDPRGRVRPAPPPPPHPPTHTHTPTHTGLFLSPSICRGHIFGRSDTPVFCSWWQYICGRPSLHRTQSRPSPAAKVSLGVAPPRAVMFCTPTAKRILCACCPLLARSAH